MVFGSLCWGHLMRETTRFSLGFGDVIPNNGESDGKEDGQ